jgi:hypothetical protein
MYVQVQLVKYFGKEALFGISIYHDLPDLISCFPASYALCHPAVQLVSTICS